MATTTVSDTEAQVALDDLIAESKARQDAKAKNAFLGSGDKTKRLLALFNAAHRAGRPMIIWGPPGVGKTSLIHAYAASKGLIVRTLIGSTMDPSDVDGLPALKEDEVTGDIFTVNTLPEWARDLIRANGGILFLDELSTAPPSVQAAMLSLIQNRRVGQHTLPESVWIIAAANEVADAADGFTLAPPTANRLMHVNFKADFDAWADGMRIAFGAEASAEELQERSLYVNFLKNRNTLWNPARPESDEEAGKAWASPRSWDNAAAVCAYLTDDEDAHNDALSGYVGKSAAGQFYAWKKKLHIPDYSVVMAYPERQDWAKFSAEEKFVILENVLAQIKAENVRATLKVFEVGGGNGASDVVTALSTRLADKIGDFAAAGVLEPKEGMTAMRTILPTLHKAKLL